MNPTLKSAILSFFPTFSNRINPIVLYHSIGEKCYFEDEGHIDHINLETLNQHLTKIKKYWRIVSIDEYVNAKNKKGLACITIDDGYKNVIDEALPVFKSHDAPFTIFINPSTFSGKMLWRDKVRVLIDNKLVEAYIEQSSIFTRQDLTKFYKISKSETHNSKLVDEEITKFMENKTQSLISNLCFDKTDYLLKDPLLSYGNHSLNHYLLASLSNAEQEYEIREAHQFLHQQDINISHVFSLPFGGVNSYNNDTIEILKGLNYKACLLSNYSLHSPKDSFLINRFIPQSQEMETLIKENLIRSKFRPLTY